MMAQYTMKTIRPTPHYSLSIPDDIHEQYDDAVLSLWKEGDGTLLQLSSTVREGGEQVSAQQRLTDRMRVGSWSNVNLKCDADCEVAAGSTKQEGYVWWHIYLVVSYVAVYATISFPTSATASDWAVEAIRTIGFGNPVNLIT
jgi:hypothetical protein